MRNIIALCLLAFISCAQTPPDNKASSGLEPEINGWKTLNEEAYSIQYPATWAVDKSGQMGTSFFIFSPLDSKTDDFRENVNLLVQDLSGRDYDLDAYVKMSENQINEVFGVTSFIENKRMKNANGDYQKLKYTGKQGSTGCFLSSIAG